MHVCVARRLNKAGGLKPFQQADPRDYLLQIVYALSEAFDQDSLSMRETQLRTAVQREDREADERARREENRLRRQENSMMKTMMMFVMSQYNTTRQVVSVAIAHL